LLLRINPKFFHREATLGNFDSTPMTAFGKTIWKEMARYAGEHGLIHPLEHFAENVVPIGPKTLRERLNTDDQWTLNELVALQSALKSQALQTAIETKFREAMQ
jgi:hypothetical protein